ncbi:MAG: TAXI family TRAP transporter solute-binding subunit [Rickettsiales bacterium]
MKKIILGLATLILCAFSAQAADKTIGMVTGPETGTYMAFGKDIAKIAARKGIDINLKPSSGSIENIRRIAESNENTQLGIVQSDVLSFLKRSEKPRSQEIAKRLRLVFPLYPEEIHVLARKDIATFRELRDKRVVIGEEGSGNMVTSMNLFALTGTRPAELIQVPPAEGILKVLSGEADAMIFVGGRPVPLFQNLSELATADNGKNAYLLKAVHFLPMDDAKIRKEYEPAVLSSGDYPFILGTVPTSAVTASLISFDFSEEKNNYYKDRCKLLDTLAGSIRDSFEALKTMGHPKWREVNLYKDIGLWTRDECAWKSVRKDAPLLSNELDRDILDVIKHGKQ